MLTRRNFLAVFGAAALVPARGAMATEVRTLGGSAFGTYWRLIVPASKEIDLRSLQTLIEDVDQEFSPYRPDSALSAFNRTAATDWLPASASFRTVLGRGLEIAGQSQGAFDPTVGPVVSRYGFGPIRAPVWGEYEQLDVSGEGVRKQDSRLSVDLCGIAKGHALDRMASDLQTQGVSEFMLDLGGELCGRGKHPSGRDWHVAVESTNGTLALAVSLGSRSIATSGIGVQSYGTGEHTVSHIVDPLSGRPVTGRTMSVSIIADDAVSADGWATALMAMDHERAIDLASAHALDAVIFWRDGDALRPTMTGAFSDHILG